MFRFHKSIDIITLFHKASSPASVRVAAALQKASTAAAEAAAANNGSRSEFKLDITEEPPTPDQLQIILGYIGRQKIPSVVKGASDETEAMKKFKENVDNFQRPVVVDWNNGKAVAGENESEILKMLNALPK
ncbi:hypothetical protein VTJ49DRAFT_5448 [Mycothermus thermophilus]|uniref:Uncharacterized protein n=1 Tax=Humicola insolens TaxID=85995 RepID=A0ABR3V4K5_HUMIN